MMLTDDFLFLILCKCLKITYVTGFAKTDQIVTTTEIQFNV